jgi:hypothetical protein
MGEGNFPSPEGQLPPNMIEVIDNISDSGELIVNDISNSYHLRCNDFNTFDYEYYTTAGTVPNPLAYIQWVILNNVIHLAKDYYLFHAGVVSWEGRGIIFPAVSDLGKTTLSLKLTMQGFKFLSDEVACVDQERGILSPFFRKLNLSEHSRQLLRLPPISQSEPITKIDDDHEWKVDIEDVVPGSLSDPCAIRYIIFLQGFGEEPRLELLANSAALFKLFKFSMRRNDNVAGLLFKFAPIIDKTRCYNLVHGDLDKTAHMVQNLVQEG